MFPSPPSLNVDYPLLSWFQQIVNWFNRVSSPITNSISGDVALNNTANYFDGPSCAQGTDGIWFATGYVTCLDTVAARFDAKLWDGTTVKATAQGSSAAAGFFVTLHLSAVFTSPAANIRISVKDASSTGGVIDANDGTNGNINSTLTVIRIG